jgi:hypothetical protein
VRELPLQRNDLAQQVLHLRAWSRLRELLARLGVLGPQPRDLRRVRGVFRGLAAGLGLLISKKSLNRSCDLIPPGYVPAMRAFTKSFT